MSTLPLVFLHGWGMTPTVWNGLRICLSPRLFDTPALPGHAPDAPSPATPTLAGWGDAILAQLPERCVLGGWSLGALIALDLARRHPERIAQLVLFGATPSFVQRAETRTQPSWAHALDRATVQDFRTAFDNAPAATLRRFLALQLQGEPRRRGVVHSLQRAAVELEQPAVLADGLGLLESTDLRAQVADIHTPTLVIHGRDDTLMPPTAGAWLAQHLPHAHFAELEDCGHAPFVSRPEACAPLINHVLDT